MAERLQKMLAQAGYGSRRACEAFISAGRIRVNGKIAELGRMQILLWIRSLWQPILLNSPRLVQSTVGRLDFESEGLVRMTNDGDLTNKLTHPKYGHEKARFGRLLPPVSDLSSDPTPTDHHASVRA